MSLEREMVEYEEAMIIVPVPIYCAKHARYGGAHPLGTGIM
jgi:hypothetical protein